MTAARQAARWMVDWEEWLSLSLAYLVFLSVAWSIQRASWAKPMPSLWLLGIGGLLAGWVLARLPMPWPLAWGTAVVWGLLATFLQALFLIPGAGLGEKVDILYLRFERYFHIVFSGGISNDTLPFLVLVAGLTFGGAFLMAWSLFRWHTAWPALALGGATLLVNFVVLDRGVLGAFLLFAISGLLLLARANLMGHQHRWQREGVAYPALLSPAHLHLAFWGVLLLLLVAWTVPTAYGRPLAHLWGAMSAPFRGLADDWARLVGPLRGGRLPRGVDLSQVLPLRGGLGLPIDGELARVRLPEDSKPVPLLLRIAAYEDYALGGWKASRRTEVEWPFQALEPPQNLPVEPTTVQVEVLRGGAPASLVMVPGQPLPVAFITADGTLKVKALVPDEAILKVSWQDGEPRAAKGKEVPDVLRSVGVSWDDEALRRALLRQGYLLLRADRRDGRLKMVEVVPLEAVASSTLMPQHSLSPGATYRAVGVVPAPPTDSSSQGSADYPWWVRDIYLALPPELPARVVELARQVAGQAPTPLAKVQAIRRFLFRYPVDQLLETPPGRDVVDHFLFEARRGPVEAHASAMVIMLRAVGVPARLAVGLLLSPGDYDEEAKAYRVTASRAMAWPEVYFPGHGWVPFAPDREDVGIFNALFQYGLPVPIGLFGPLGPEDSLLAEILGTPEPPLEGAPSPQVGGGRGVGGPLMWALLATAGAIAVGGVAVRLIWQKLFSRLPEAQQIWEKTVLLAGWAGLGPRPGETPHEFARRLGRALPGFSDLTPLAHGYCLSRYGRRPPPQQLLDHLQRLWPHLRGALLWQMVRRPWRVGRAS
jgi:hypothetical protein